MQQQNRDLQWYAKEFGLTHLASQMADVMKIADHQGWSLEQTIQTLLEEKACQETEGTHQHGRILADQVSGAAGQERVA